MKIIYRRPYGLFGETDSGFCVVDHHRMTDIGGDFYYGPLFRLDIEKMNKPENEIKDCYYYDPSSYVICIEHENMLSFVCTTNRRDIKNSSDIFDGVSIAMVKNAIQNIDDFLNCENKNHRIIDMRKT